MAGQPHDVRYKVLMVGDSGVGKTALIKNLMGKSFNNNHLATIGIDFVTKVFDIDGARVQLEIWDTAGQERFRTITRFQYRGARGLMLVYDMTDKKSFDMLNYWLESIDREIDGNNKEPVPVVIAGNKRDLDHLRQVTFQHGRKIAEENLVSSFVETSAKDGDNVEAAFYHLAQAITEINNPKLMDSYLNPEEKKEKYMRRQGGLSLTAPRFVKPDVASKANSGTSTSISIRLCFPGKKDKAAEDTTCCNI